MTLILFSIILFLISACPLQAQGISIVMNAPRGGDVLVSHQVEATDFFHDDSSQMLDLRNAELRNKTRLSLKSLGRDDSLACVSRFGRNYLVLRNDTLYFSGSENNQMRVSYLNPIPVLAYTLKKDASADGVFQAKGTYCDKWCLSAMGKWQLSANDGDVVITPDGDSLRHVLRVTLARQILSRYHLLSDSLQFFEPLSDDSIHWCLRQEEMPVSEEDRMWFVPGYRYPVLTSHSTTLEESSVTDAWYYAPESQSALAMDPENEALRKAIAQGSYSADGSSFALQYTISGGANEGFLHVSYSLSRSAKVEFILTDVRGMTYSRAVQGVQSAGSGYTADISLTGLPRGQYVLYLCCDGQRKAEKFSIH
jgi:hypothetical protein